MSTSLQLFEHPSFGQVRTIERDGGEILFCGKDVAEALGYKDPTMLLSSIIRGQQITISLRRLVVCKTLALLMKLISIASSSAPSSPQRWSLKRESQRQCCHLSERLTCMPRLKQQKRCSKIPRLFLNLFKTTSSKNVSLMPHANFSLRQSLKSSITISC